MVSSGLPRATIDKSFSLANDYHKKLSVQKNIKRAEIYKNLVDRAVDWAVVNELTVGDEDFSLLHTKSRLMLATNALSEQVVNDLSINRFNQFIKQHKDMIYSPDLESLLPDIVFQIVTKPYNKNKVTSPVKTENYLSYVANQDLPAISDSAKSLKKRS